MERPARAQRNPRARAACVAACCAFLAGATIARADEVGGTRSARGIVIHDAEETLARWCVRDPDGRLWLELSGNLRFELVTSTVGLPNPGDGSFHPFDPSEVRAALEGLAFPLAGIDADVFLLPYPRRGAFESAAGPGLALLAPGVLPVARERQHAELSHEIGHVVQYARMPDADESGWTEYRRIRGIEDPRFCASAPHADRPHEIFAEDFRYLFGDALARGSESIENATLALPDAVPGLGAFLIALGDPAPAAALRALTNPARGALEFAGPAGSSAPLDLFDATGRRVATLEPRSAAGETRWSWDGPAGPGRRIPPGVLFARVRGATGAVARVTLLP